ncbi:hypothetical protein BDV10DRAFT_187732 [Aspergillus recurvatus]
MADLIARAMKFAILRILAMKEELEPSQTPTTTVLACASATEDAPRVEAPEEPEGSLTRQHEGDDEDEDVEPRSSQFAPFSPKTQAP